MALPPPADTRRVVKCLHALSSFQRTGNPRRLLPRPPPIGPFGPVLGEPSKVTSAAVALSSPFSAIPSRLADDSGKTGFGWPNLSFLQGLMLASLTGWRPPGEPLENTIPRQTCQGHRPARAGYRTI